MWATLEKDMYSNTTFLHYATFTILEKMTHASTHYHIAQTDI